MQRYDSIASRERWAAAEGRAPSIPVQVKNMHIAGHAVTQYMTRNWRSIETARRIIVKP